MRSILALAGVWLFAGPAFANDSTAEIGAGGLVLTRTADIDMRSEELFISENVVRVTYRFFNRSPADVSTRVAFPLPDIAYESQDSNLAIPDTDSENFLGFTTWASGAAVKMSLEQKALVKGVDRTLYLRQLGISPAFFLGTAAAALQKLPRETWAEFIRLGLGEISEYDDGQGMLKHLEPRWTLQSAYHWQQLFPAGQETVIEHRYKPAVGQSAGTAIGTKDWEKSQAQAYRRKYCLDASALGFVAQAARKARNEYAPITESRIEYILKTAANWASPIGEFRLVVDKGAAENVLSVCGAGWKKISATQFELRKTSFTPIDDFYLLILKPRSDN